jgi:hypothetical protein
MNLFHIAGIVTLTLLFFLQMGCNRMQEPGGVSYDQTDSEPIGDQPAVASGGAQQRHEMQKPAVGESETTEAGGQDSEATVEQLREELRQEKEEFVREIEEQLVTLDKRYQTMQQKARQAGEEAESDIQQSLAKIEQQRQKLRGMLDELGQSREDDWKQFRQGVQSAWDELRISVDGAASQFKLRYGDDLQIDVDEEGVNVDVDEDADEKESGAETTKPEEKPEAAGGKEPPQPVDSGSADAASSEEASTAPAKDTE